MPAAAAADKGKMARGEIAGKVKAVRARAMATAKRAMVGGAVAVAGAAARAM